MNIDIIGKKIGELRREREFTQEDLAKELGISAQAVSKWENGGAPDIEMLPALADFFGVSIDYLYGRAERKNADLPLTEREIFEKIVDLQERMSLESYSLYSLENSLAYIQEMHFEDDDAKKEAVEQVASAIRITRSGFNGLLSFYHEMLKRVKS